MQGALEGLKIFTSPDGATWTPRMGGPGSNGADASTYANGMFLTGGYCGGMQSSLDGITWKTETAHPGSPACGTIRSVAFGGA